MGKVKATDTLTRLWQLIALLPPPHDAGQPVTALHASGEMDYDWTVSLRTTQRDLAFLEQNGFATRDGRADSESDQAKCWRRTERGTPQRIRTTSTEEMLALYLISDVADKLLPPEVMNVLRTRLDAAVQTLEIRGNADLNAGWAGKIAMVINGFPLQPPQLANNRILPDLQSALLTNRKVRVIYQSRTPRAQPKPLVLEPRGLWNMAELLYLVATHPRHPDNPTSYRVDRIRHLEILNEASSRSAFKLRPFLDAGGSQFAAALPKVTFRAWVGPSLANRLAETPIAKDMTLRRQPDGAVIEVRLRLSEQFKQWLLIQGPDLKVLAPRKLREETAQTLRAAAAAYDRKPR